MNFSQGQRDQINKLIDHRNDIDKALFHIERILREYFPEEYNVAYQHWIPQIVTALYNDNKWLPRGQFTMQDTVNHLLDKESDSFNKGVSKYI